MTVSNTPTPWEVFDSGRLLVIAPEAGWSVFEIADSHPTERPIHEANAAFIVQAVNSHGDLVAALTALRNECSGTPQPDRLITLLPLADAALAKAKGAA